VSALCQSNPSLLSHAATIGSTHVLQPSQYSTRAGNLFFGLCKSWPMMPRLREVAFCALSDENATNRHSTCALSAGCRIGVLGLLEGWTARSRNRMISLIPVLSWSKLSGPISKASRRTSEICACRAVLFFRHASFISCGIAIRTFTQS